MADSLTRHKTRLWRDSWLIGWLAALMCLSITGCPSPSSTSQPSVGKPFPPLQVEGWLNGPEPAAAELEGKVRVIEAWAYWCGPCVQAAPHVVELHHKYHDRGVVFLGLTPEGSGKLSASENFLAQGKITWPNGYGAMETLGALAGADGSIALPMMWVVDQKGITVWAGHPLSLKESLLDDLLKQ